MTQEPQSERHLPAMLPTMGACTPDCPVGIHHSSPGWYVGTRSRVDSDFFHTYQQAELAYGTGNLKRS